MKTRSFAKSQAAFTEAKKVIPGGVNSPVRAFGSVGGDPVFLERGKGSHVFDIDGNTYLDYDYSAIPLSKAYAFDPVPEKLHPEYHDKVIGSGCQMWGEWIPTNGHMHFLAFPRIAAYAEVGWTEKRNKNFDDFKEALDKLQKRWEQKGIYYAPLSAVEL